MSHDFEQPARAAFAQERGRKGDWMQTVSGRMFWPLDPRADEVDIYDIAVGLSNECRYAGQIEDHYSVAQHSVYVSYEVPAEWALEGLLHDAPEAYLKDIHRPLKRHLKEYGPIEDAVWGAVAEKFDLARELPELITHADNAVLLAEKEQIVGESPAPWLIKGEPARIQIVRMTPREARERFLDRFNQLMDQRKYHKFLHRVLNTPAE
jgi:hypothetical protein